MNCFMDLRLFSFDSHLCPLSFYSYAHRDYQIKMGWNSQVPVTFPNIEIAEYDLGNTYIRKDIVRAWRTGNFSCLDAYFVVNRQFGFYGLYFYFPSIVCVLTSWIGLWIKIEYDISEARVTLPIAGILTLATFQQVVLDGLPRVSYVKAIDIWTLLCYFFILGTLIEYALALVSYSSLTRSYSVL